MNKETLTFNPQPAEPTEVITPEKSPSVVVARQADLPDMAQLTPKVNQPQPSALLPGKIVQLPVQQAEALQTATIFIDFENDIFTGTDYYYTNGVTIGVAAPWLSFIRHLRLLPGLGELGRDRFSISLTQKMYTGLNPEAEVIVEDDHPFSGLLYAELTRTSLRPEDGLLLKSSLTVGFTGKLSLASSVQSLMHELEPSGWELQTGNSLLLNYSIMIEKELVKGRFGQLTTGTELKAGNLETLTAGFFKLSMNLFPSSNTGAGLQAYATARGNLVLHKASLRGGLWGSESPHIVSFNDLSKTVAELSAGLVMHAGRSGLGIKVVYLSPEFRQGRPHSWGALQLMRNL
ncbi:MAG TPA: lipid A deacylase LpxR family protein [Bacteroidales bacterium]|nr:lipid A deacylase LpxR family protein [Bacteroidales bacterium]